MDARGRKIVGIIYIARCRTTGKRYVGQTVRSFHARLLEHKAPSHFGTGRYFHSAIRKYGFDDFEFTTIGNIPDAALDALETFFIRTLGTIAPGGYNLKIEGHGGRLSAETRRKISESNTGRVPGFGGKRHRPETRALMSGIMKGRIITPEARKKISASLRGNVPWNKGKKGLYRATEEAKRHQREAWERKRAERPA